ncbi:MAG: hypothetical protein ABH842_03295 [Candidatus Micrarchaeota archaeon]
MVIFINPQPQLSRPTFREHKAQCGSFRNYLKESKRISHIEDMIRYPIRHPGEDSGSVFREGMELFAGLTEAGKHKTMRELAKDLRSIPSYLFDSAEQTRKLTVIATFFAEAAAYLPVDERGDKITTHLDDVVAKLRSLADVSSHYRSDDPSKSAAKVASLNALWELCYGNLNFWDEFLLGNDEACQSVVIKLMLEEPMREGLSWEEHPWADLRQHLSVVGMDILQSPYEKKFDFFQRMLFDEDIEIVRTTLEILTYAESLPPYFYAIARDIGAQTPELASTATSLHTIHSLRAQLDLADDRQFIAARHLIQLFQQHELNYLRPLLEQTGSEILSVYAEPADSITDDIQERRAMLVRIGVKMPGSAIEPIRVTPQSGLETYRDADEDTLNILPLNHLAELTGLIWADKKTLTQEEENELDRIGAVILRKIKQQEERQKALSVLIEYNMAGIQIPGFQLDIRTTGGAPVAEQKQLQNMSFDEICEFREGIREAFTEAKKTNDERTQTALREQLGELRTHVLERFQNFDELTIDQLVQLNRIVCIGQTYGQYSDDTLSRLDAIAAVAIQRIKRNRMLVPPLIDDLEQMKPERRKAAEAKIHADAERQARFDNLVPDTSDRIIEAAQILHSREGIQLTLQGPRLDLERGYLSDYLITFLSHRPVEYTQSQVETTLVPTESKQQTVLYEPYLVGTIHDFLVDRWTRLRSWFKGGKHE